MYEKFYNLNQNPFQISTDPKFLWLGKKHKEALATLQYGVLDNKSFLLLTGDIGTGKTTLINALLQLHGKDTLVATIKDPNLPPLDLFNYLAYSFGIPDRFTSKGEFLIAFDQFLKEKYYHGKKVLLVIDEAQRLQQDTLEEIRCLSNIEIDGNKLIRIYFIGQNEFNEILAREENKAIRQRITVNYNIQPLEADEISKYIEYRLTVAGGHKKIFDKGALKEISNCTTGYPRLINILCDRCLLTGFVQGLNTITKKIVAECHAELAISFQPTDKRKTGTPPTEARKLKPHSHPFRLWHLTTILGFSLAIAILVLANIGYDLSPLPPDSQVNQIQSVTQQPAASAPTPTPTAAENVQEESKQVSSKTTAAISQKLQIHFTPNSITPSPEDIELLKSFSDNFININKGRIIITGHTDTDGSAHFNKRLAEFRANTIKTFLVARGVDIQKITSTGVTSSPRGGSHPPQDNQSLRRVDLEIEFPTEMPYSAKN